MTSAGRRGFERLYDLPERVAPSAHPRMRRLPRASDAQRALDRASRRPRLASPRKLSCATTFAYGVAETKARVAELVEAEVLRPVSRRRLEAARPICTAAPNCRASVDVRALISPFDSLIWMRQRTDRLFDFHYRLAFYTPKHKRKQGYYVMPFLSGDRLVARVDLKSDRKKSRLLVLGGHVGVWSAAQGSGAPPQA